MNMSNFAIWLKCFWAVICPSWWTLALVGLALIAFAITLGCYSRNQIEHKKGESAMQKVGRRWQRAGWIMLGVAAAVYVVELIGLNAATTDLLANRAKLNKTDVARVLYKSQYDFAFFCARNKHLMTSLDKIEAVKGKFAIKPQISYADKTRLDLGRTFSKYLAPTGNKRFYPTPNSLPDAELKRETVEKLITLLDLTPSDPRYKMVTNTAKDEFTPPENRDALERLKVLLSDEFSKELVSVRYTTGDTKWSDLKSSSKDSIRNGTDGLRKRLIKSNAERVKRIFDSPINPDIRSSASFEEYLENVHGEIDSQMRKEMTALLSTDNFWKIRNEIIGELEKTPGFMNEKFAKQLDLFNIKLRAKLSRQWKTRMDGIINLFLEKWKTEALLYNNDQLTYQQLHINQKAFNGKLVFLYVSSPYLHDLFWLALLAVIVLIFFWSKGAQIIRTGNPRTVANKINN